ncbi:hypothetical protein PGTUg99_035716 [Puccinia graminis f. sp. tritici]|uniref:Uncharacterized protein n=1 Tax=Puccinia graminis f. sp. tritici TaxID=56615 RepID=A0A5B0RRZ5_PUCGR|nr:hypothetical protein PGTUg99_035716 [Puccinia graminis f. sp. tritici]
MRSTRLSSKEESRPKFGDQDWWIIVHSAVLRLVDHRSFGRPKIRLRGDESESSQSGSVMGRTGPMR